ncbi:hypothetical protein RJ641_005237 [Dillenia turbinata]|uniref:Uncharacterized protein n=1 Tax=Dillenia turbinata TaxID=194707 RepID=A0AAN8VGL6_9MAGN
MEQKIISWESYDSYKHLKSLGYIVGRHKFPWTPKNVDGTCESAASHDTTESNRLRETEYINSLSEEFNNLQIHVAVPVFDLYLPNSKGNPPSVAEIRGLKNHCSRIPLKFCHVDHGRVSFFSFAEGIALYIKVPAHVMLQEYSGGVHGAHSKLIRFLAQSYGNSSADENS